ncbi:hypothetical protein Taro_009412 [Colocasia esculenta]|uniref:Uncharacterized protein n=1 Tax=Colocasia esculenta TaxID=4460 RepID=A0A843U0T2_COLES|nr:hypothetical protein [Colocasia esculenta]
MAEMEMDMDIPLPEELEWLENTTLHQDDEEVLREEYEEEDLLLEPSTGTIPTEDPLSEGPSPHSPGRQTYRKRPWPEEIVGPEAPKEVSSEEKRRKARAAGDFEEDEEWLRYSPSKDTAPGPSVVVRTAVDDDLVVDAAAPDESAVPEENFLSRFASEIEGDCIPVTGPRGDMVYAKVSAEAPDAGPKKLRMARSGLLTEPINVLIERVEREALTKALQESTTSPADPLHATNPVCEQLWVEKYAPKSFTELLSDEQTNREVLLWLKQWDSCVFGCPIQATSDDVLFALRRHSTITQHQKPFDNKNAFGKKLTPLDGQMSNQSKNMDDENDTLKGSGDLWSKKSKTNNTPEQKIMVLLFEAWDGAVAHHPDYFPPSLERVD